MADLLVAHQGNTTIIEFADKEVLDIAKSTELGVRLREIIDQSNDPNLLIDFGRVRLITSSVIGELLQAHKKCQDNKIHLKLCNFSNELTGLFKKLKLDKVFEIYASRFDALKAFATNK
jgi:anti-anti-sigma factor